jgi:biotin-(acetyl-CoA carboxylase) ligase
MKVIAVILENGRKYVLPFSEPEEVIFANYGNYTQLEGRQVKIEYQNNNIAGGSVKIVKDNNNSLIGLHKLNRVYDIGKLLG